MVESFIIDNADANVGYFVVHWFSAANLRRRNLQKKDERRYRYGIRKEISTSFRSFGKELTYFDYGELSVEPTLQIYRNQSIT